MKRNILVLVSLSALLFSVNAFAGDDDRAQVQSSDDPAAQMAAQDTIKAGAKQTGDGFKVIGQGVAKISSNVATDTVAITEKVGDDIKDGTVKSAHAINNHVIQPALGGVEKAAGETETHVLKPVGHFFADPYTDAFDDRAKPGFAADSKAIAKGTGDLIGKSLKDTWNGIVKLGHWFQKEGSAVGNHFRDKIAEKKLEKEQKKIAKAEKKAAERAAKDEALNQQEARDLGIHPITQEAVASNSITENKLVVEPIVDSAAAAAPCSAPVASAAH